MKGKGRGKERERGNRRERGEGGGGGETEKQLNFLFRGSKRKHFLWNLYSLCLQHNTTYCGLLNMAFTSLKLVKPCCSFATTDISVVFLRIFILSQTK